MTSKALELAAEAVNHGWTVRITPGVDSGNNDFVMVEAVRQPHEFISVTWHTRGTGTYRLFNAMVGRRAARATLTRVRVVLAAESATLKAAREVLS